MTGARALAALSLSGLLAGCSATGPADPPPAPPAPASAPATSDAGPADPVRPVDPAEDPLPPRDAETVPAVRSGPLDETALPRAGALGRGWRPYADPGDAEKGFRGNGSWVREREAGELVAGIAPLGCRGGSVAVPALPQPRHALEGTYEREGGDTAVALALGFATPGAARNFLRAYGARLEACGTPADDGEAAYALGVVTLEADDDLVVDRRYEAGPDAGVAWTEIAARSGARVTLLTVPGEVDPRALVAAVRPNGPSGSGDS